MSGKRFVALIAHDMDTRAAWERAVATTIGNATMFERLVVGDRFALIAECGASIAVRQEGFVIGTVFERGRTSALRVFDEHSAGLIVASRGEWLIRAHWGSYVAIVAARERNSIEVVRSPLGDLPCYFLQSRFGLFIASDVDLLISFTGYVPQIAWPALVQHLTAPDLRRRSTCLEGLSELAGGERLADGEGRQTIDALWSPWDFVEASKRLTDPADAAVRVRDAVEMAVAASTGMHDKVLLRLSGGLDSSIIAACLKRANRSFTALTLVTHDQAGDERLQARAVAEHLGVELVDAMREVELVDLETSQARGLPQPSARAFGQASAKCALNAALACEATAIVDGGGGDNVFGSVQSTAPVVDCLQFGGGAGLFWKTARSIGIAAHSSTLKVARRALLRRWSRGPAFRWPIDLDLLSSAACDMAASTSDHPWLVPPYGALPGSAAHVALLAAAQSIVQSRDPRIALADLSPLVSQPVVEACLRVPSWLWTRDGYNRAIAREAFRDALPREIVNRRDKGAPDSFVVELVVANRALIRDLLCDGLMTQHGIINRTSVAAALAPKAIAKGLGYVRLMQLVDAEAWVQSWLVHRAGQRC
jgi:asparagine synthase (glutamine-hydrolysing)